MGNNQILLVLLNLLLDIIAKSTIGRNTTGQRVKEEGSVIDRPTRMMTDEDERKEGKSTKENEERSRPDGKLKRIANFRSLGRLVSIRTRRSSNFFTYVSLGTTFIQIVFKI